MLNIKQNRIYRCTLFSKTQQDAKVIYHQILRFPNFSTRLEKQKAQIHPHMEEDVHSGKD